MSIIENYKILKKLDQTLENIDEKTILRGIKKELEKNIFDVDNEYLKLGTLDLIYKYTLIEKLPHSYLEEIINDILKESVNFVKYCIFLEKIIKICFLEDIRLNQELIDEIKDKELQSTYYYYKGISLMSKAIYKVGDNEEEYIKKLFELKKIFIYSNKIYNRCDSIFYAKVIDVLISIRNKRKLESQFIILKDEYKRLMNLSLYENREYETDIMLFVESLSKVSSNLEKESEWINYELELNKLVIFIQETLSYEYKKNLKELFGEFKENFIKSYVCKKIYNEYRSFIPKLEILIEKSDDEIFIKIFKVILDEIKLNSKKIEIKEWVDILSKSKVLLSRNNCEILNDKLYEIVQDGTKENNEKFNDILEILLESLTFDKDLLTGYPEGDEITKNIIKEVRGLLKNRLETKKIISLQNVIAEIINYIFTIATTGKELFPIYYNDYEGKLSEELFQQDLFYSLKRSNYSSKYLWEVEKISDNGRCDIVYKSDDITIPIEMKKTTIKKLTKEKIEEKYVSQATTYTYPYGKVGILILIDVSEKSKKYIPNSIEDMIQIHQKDAHLELDENTPGVVISVIIPARRNLPSSKSSY